MINAYLKRSLAIRLITKKRKAMSRLTTLPTLQHLGILRLGTVSIAIAITINPSVVEEAALPPTPT